MERAIENPPPPRRVWWSLLIGAGVSAFAFWLIARTVNAQATWDALAASNLVLVLLACLAQLAAMLFTVKRWQVLLRPYPTHFRILTQIYFAAHLLNTLLPFKLGTVARVLLAAEEEKINLGYVFGSVAIEKVLDTIVTLVLLLVLAPFIPMPEWLRDSVIVSALLVLAALLLLVSVRRLREPLLHHLGAWETRVLGRESKRVSNFARGILDSLLNLTRRRELAAVLFWTMCMWLAGALVNQLLFWSLGMSVSWSAIWFVILALQLGTRIPALPANLGVFHYVVILALGLYGVNESAALAFAILLHLVVFVFPAFIGALAAVPLTSRLIALAAHGAPKIENDTAR